MKSGIIFLTMFILLGATSAQTKPDWNDYQLKGKVKSLKAKETHRYKKDGVVFTPWEKSYGKLVLFNNAGLTTEYSEFFGNDSLYYKITYTYNPKEKKADLSYFDRTLKPTIKKKYIYDDKGRRIEEIEYDKAGQLDRRYTYAYDDKGNMTEITGYKKDGTMSSKTTYTYDSRGYRTEYKIETPGYATSSRKFVNDDKGNVTGETWYSGTGPDFRFVRTYDANGNKIQETKYKGTDSNPRDMNTWSYVYDKKGNWTKRTETTGDGDDFHIEERVIVYY